MPNVADEFNAIAEYFSPRVIASANGQYVKLAKFRGEFPFHAHADEDEGARVDRLGEEVVDAVADGAAEGGAEEERRGEDAAGRPGADRRRGRDHLREVDERELRREDLVAEDERRRLVAVPEDLGVARGPDRADDEAAERRLQGERELYLREDAVRGAERLEEERATRRRGDAEERSGGIVLLARP